MKALLQIIRPALIALALFAMSMFITPRVASAQEEKKPAAAHVEDKSMLDLYEEGGWVMHMIALTSVGMLSVLVYCIVRINAKKMIPAGFQASLEKALAKQDVDGAMRICENDGSSLSHVIRETLTKAGAGVAVYTKADLEAAASETIFHEETKFMLWVNMLNAFAAVAPMIGLLGTVSGMIQSFNKLSSGAAKASDFAGGIGEAMVATAAGLLVAIPAMFAYFMYKNILQSLIARLSHSTSTLINKFVSGAAVEYTPEEA
ncbi:MAG TPA: MotA/TolQ/ExbB proton channel family protein [Luteolibacter sp.]|nr:MotA/TolQ/ExbB proton channel family protein [Luteolibacter sp.]